MTQATAIDPRWPAAMQADEAARYLGVSKRTFKSFVSDGRITGRKASGKLILYPRTDLDKFVEKLPKGRGERPGLS